MSTDVMSTGRITRRRFLRGTVAAAGAAALAGTVPGVSYAAPGRKGTVTINHWDWWVSQAPWVDNEIKLFQAAHPGITIKKTTNVTNEYANLFALAVKSGNEPDVFMIPQTPTLADQVARGWLLPIDKWATAAWRARFPRGVFHEGSNMFNGRLYTAPFSGPAPWLQLYVNHQVFRNAGLTNRAGSVKLPRTWDDVSRAAAAITKKSGGSTYGLGFGNNQNFILAWWLELFVRGAGSPGGAYSMDNRVGKWTFATDRNYMDFIDLLLEWKNKGYFYPNSMSISDETARAFFERGKFGMTVGGVWNQPEWTQHHFTDYSLITLPTPGATPRGYFYYTPGGTLWAISARTKHPAESWAWFDWLYSPAAGKRWVQMGEDLSIFPEDDNPRLITFRPFAQYVATRRYDLPMPDPSVRNPQTSHVIPAAIHPDINDVMAGIYTGQIKDIKGALAALAARYLKAQTDAVALARKQGYKVSLSDYVFPDWDITKPYYTKPGQG
jgi:ABC-type glycerol-3-phosphate transport system substrate-binding protein